LVIKYINTDLEKCGNKAFFMIYTSVWAKLKIWPKRKNSQLQSTILNCQLSKKKLRLFTIFKLYLYFPDFSSSKTLLGKFQHFFKNSRLCTNPVNNSSKSLRWDINSEPLESKLDCKTVSFFPKISKEIGKAWCKSPMHAKRASLTLRFQPRSRPFVWLLVLTWIRKNTDCFAV